MKHWKQTIDIDREVQILLISGLNPKEMAHLLDRPIRSIYNSLARIKKLAKTNIDK